ncbi:hypothetical protein VNI00_007685 [Paramarasmius palmivorus]|uniref:Uncharacterized protein n=1 Tax=Paramarasmius palmivorus TaxID=297713 RepID=A0AAW0D648_9AGAR
MSSPTHQKIQQHAEPHNSLIHRLKELEGLPNQLTRHQEYLDDLMRQRKNSQDKLEKVVAVIARFDNAEPVRKGWLPSRRADNERKQNERERMEALETEFREQRKLRELDEKLETGLQIKDTLSQNLIRLNNAKEELQSLHDQIFEDPTPEFPEDEELQSNLKYAREAHDNIYGSQLRLQQAVECLVKAEEKMDVCLEKIRVLLLNAASEYGANNRLFGEHDRRYVQAVFEASSEAQTCLNEARDACPEIPAIQDVRVSHHPLIMENFMFSGIGPVETMRMIRSQFIDVKKTIQNKCRQAVEQSIISAEYDLDESTKVLDQCRESLMQHRISFIESVLDGRRSPSPRPEPSPALSVQLADPGGFQMDVPWSPDGPPPSYISTWDH